MHRRDSQGREEWLTFAEHLGSHVPELTSAECRGVGFNWAGLSFKKKSSVLLPTCLIINPANTLAPSLSLRRLSSLLPPHLKHVCCCVILPSDLKSVHQFPPLAHFSSQLPLFVCFLIFLFCYSGPRCFNFPPLTLPASP